MALAKVHGQYQIKPNTIDVGRLNVDFLKSVNWAINGLSVTKATITTIPDPIDDEDVANKRYVDSKVGSGGGNYTLPIASNTILGGIKVGTGLVIDGNGILSATGGGTGANILFHDKKMIGTGITGIIDGINDTFELEFAPIVDSEMIFINGILYDPGLDKDYVVTNTTIVFNVDSIPQVGDKLLINYRSLA